MIEIVEYNDKHADDLSDIIISNMYTINIKDHGKEVIDKISVDFTSERIKIDFPKREKCFVALKDKKVVGTTSLDRLRGDETGKNIYY